MAGNLIAFVVCLPWALPLSRRRPGLGLIVYLGVVQIGLAYLLLAAAVRHVPAFEVSLLLLVEPALNPVWSWLVHGETPSGVAIAGGVLILGATAAKVWLDWRRSPAAGTSPCPLPPRRDAGGAGSATVPDRARPPPPPPHGRPGARRPRRRRPRAALPAGAAPARVPRGRAPDLAPPSGSR